MRPFKSISGPGISGVPLPGIELKRLFCFQLSNRTPHDSKTSAWGRGRKGLDGMRKLGGSSRIIRWAGRIVKPGAYGENP